VHAFLHEEGSIQITSGNITFILETLWLRPNQVTRHSVEFIAKRKMPCLVQAVGYRSGMVPLRPIHIHQMIDDENALSHDSKTLHRPRCP
jgi:hypothetical protein